MGRGEQRRCLHVRGGGIHHHGHVQAGVRGQPVGNHPSDQSGSPSHPQSERYEACSVMQSVADNTGTQTESLLA